MNELDLDAESIARNKTYGAIDHLQHLLKIGWSTDSPLIKKYLKENNLTDNDLSNAISKMAEMLSKECCIDREKIT